MVIALWVVAVVVAMPLGSKLQDETTDDTESFLPDSAESTAVVRKLNEDFSAGETTTGLIVYQHEGGLTAADKRKIAADARDVEAARTDDGAKAVPLTQPPQVPFTKGSPASLVSPNGDVAYTLLTVPTDFDHVADWGKAIREITGEQSNGMRILLSGDVGFSTDADEVFSDIDTKLLLATVVLVLVLLGAIYRSVLVALTPLIVVFFAYTVAQAFIYLLAKSGVTVSSNSTSILIVLMFGVGTDYCLLLVSRYREELQRIEDKHGAMGRALRRSGPAILASGLTVTLAMLVLTLADSGNTSSLGPVAAIGVASGMIAGLTLLPALLTAFGRTGLLAPQERRRLRPRASLDRAPGRLAALRRQGAGEAAAGAAGDRDLLPRRLARAARLQGRLLDHHLLQEVRRQRRGLRHPRAVLPRRGDRAGHRWWSSATAPPDAWTRRTSPPPWPRSGRSTASPP